MKQGRLIILTLLLSLLFFYPSKALADVINPAYFTASCNPGETEIECSWTRNSISGPIKDGCTKYKNNPNYRYLEGTGSTFGGENKYCFKPVSTNNLVMFYLKEFLFLFTITFLIELPIFILHGLRSKKAILSVTTANLISTFFLYLATITLPFSGFLPLLAMELAVIAFEVIIIKNSLKNISLRKIMISVLVANIVSATLGTFFLRLGR